MTQPNNTQPNGTLPDTTKPNDTQPNDTQLIDNQHYIKINEALSMSILRMQCSYVKS